MARPEWFRPVLDLLILDGAQDPRLIPCAITGEDERPILASLKKLEVFMLFIWQLRQQN